VAPQERTRAVVTFQGQAPGVAGAGDADQPELAFDDLRSRHDVGVVAVRLVEPRRRARRERARSEFVERVRVRPLDLQELAEVPVAGEEDDAFDPFRDQPIGKRALLGRVTVPALEAARALPELAAAGDDLDDVPRRRR